LGSQSDPARARVKVRNLPGACLQPGHSYAISAVIGTGQGMDPGTPFASPPPDVGGWAMAWLSPLGLLPKGSTDGSLKYRLIFLLSSGDPSDFPGGVNGSIPRDLTVTRYPTFKEVLRLRGEVSARIGIVGMAWHTGGAEEGPGPKPSGCIPGSPLGFGGRSSIVLRGRSSKMEEALLAAGSGKEDARSPRLYP
jgi:hypothetical protein